MNNNVDMTKPCKHCQNQIPVKAKKCMFCGKNQGMPGWAIALIVVGVILVLAVAAGGSSDSDSDKNSNENSNATASNESTKKNKNNFTLGETFKFDDLEITLGTKITYTKVNNKFSEYHKKVVVKLPIKVKNLRDENHSLNMFYVKAYGSKGVELHDISTYFSNKEAVEFAGDLRSGASYDKYLYFLYDGDGEYQIEFSELIGETKTVTFNIKK